MVHTTTWNSGYESLPADAEQLSQGASRIRNLKRDIRERMEIDHDWDDVDNAGKHNQVTLQDIASDPTFAAGEIGIWNNAGALNSRTGSGTVQSFDRFPSGTKMVFFQTSAPTGWTQDVANDDAVLRVVDGAGGGTGGSWTVSGLTADAHTHGAGSFIVNANVNVEGGGSRGGFGGAGNQSVSGISAVASTNGITSDGTWRPSYIDVIVCTKD